MKIKVFLDSMGYFLLLGSTDGIETNYRRIMHAKREIPVSCCPSEVDNLLYASGGLGGAAEQEEKAQFRDLLDRLDAKAAPYEVKKPTMKREKSLFRKKRDKGISGGEWLRVDTEGRFRFGKDDYIIAEQEIQYQAVETEYGDYYAMDRILASGGKFYDMNYDEVEVFRVGGTVEIDDWPYDLMD